MKKLSLCLCFTTILTGCGDSVYYLCWNQQRTAAVSFQVYTDWAVTIDDIYSYHVLTSETEPLNASMPGGSHILKYNNNSVTLQAIQDTVSVRYRLANGEVVADYSQLDGDRDRPLLAVIHRFHVTFPKIEAYTFDRTHQALSLTHTYLRPPRKTIKQRFVLLPDDNWTEPENVGTLSASELASFPHHSQTFSYPLCEREHGSVKRVLRFWDTLLKRV